MVAQEKALKWIQEKLISIGDALSGKEQRSRQDIKKLNEAESALTTAKVALQRQTAATAICPEKRHDVLACPRCGHYLDGKPFFCHNCGQHIKYGKPDLTKFTTIDILVGFRVTKKCVDEKSLIVLEADNGTTITLNLVDIVDGDCEADVSFKAYY